MEQPLDLIVIAQERDEQVRWPILKNETQRDITATLENLVAKFANPQATVNVRPPERLGQLTQCQQALHSLVLRQAL